MALDVMINLMLLYFKLSHAAHSQDTVIHTESSHKITHKINQQRLHTVIGDFYSDLEAKYLILIHVDGTTYSCQASSAWKWQ